MVVGNGLKAAEISLRFPWLSRLLPIGNTHRIPTSSKTGHPHIYRLKSEILTKNFAIGSKLLSMNAKF